MQQNHEYKFTDAELIEAHSRTPYVGALAHKFCVPRITVWRRCTALGLKFKGGHKGAKSYALSDILAGKYPQYPTTHLKRRLLEEGILKTRAQYADWIHGTEKY